MTFQIYLNIFKFDYLISISNKLRFMIFLKHILMLRVQRDEPD